MIDADLLALAMLAASGLDTMPSIYRDFAVAIAREYARLLAEREALKA